MAKITMSVDYDYIFKVCFLGQGNVGKTSLILRYTQNAFIEDYKPTLGTDFAIKKLTIEGRKIALQIWDLAGQPRFNSVRELYYKGSHGGLLVFDITRRDSFSNLNSWVEELYKNSGRGIMPIALLGNKVDLRDETDDPITPEEAQAYIRELKKKYELNFEVPYLETSAKTGDNVDESFNILAHTIRDYIGK